MKLSASGMAHDDFRKRMRVLVDEVKARGEPKAEDQSIAGLLLKLKNPKTGANHNLLDHLTSAGLRQHMQPLSHKHCMPVQGKSFQMTGWRLSLPSCTKVALRPPPSPPHGPCKHSFLPRQGLPQHIDIFSAPDQGAALCQWQRQQSQRCACRCRFMITQHPEVEKKVLAELDALGLLVTPERPNPRQLEWDDLGKLTYTNACIKVLLGRQYALLSSVCL